VDRLRFDFTHPQAVTKDQIMQIEFIINTHIMACDPVIKTSMGLREAKETGAMAFFAEKYKEVVRVVSIGDYSKELCGGTHLNTTGQIGLFKVTSENAVAQGIRRIEAVTGKAAWEYSVRKEMLLEEIAHTLKAPVTEVNQRVNTQVQRMKSLERELANFRFEFIRGELDSIIDNAESTANSKIIAYSFREADADMLRRISDLIKQNVTSAVLCLGSEFNGSAFLLVSVTDDLVKKGIKANEIIRDIASLINGSGGGRPEMAQAGSKETAKLKFAVHESKEILRKILSQ